MLRYTGSVQFKASKVLHHRYIYIYGYTKTAIMAEQLILGMWPTISYLLSPKQHSMIRFVRIPHIAMKRKSLTQVGSPNMYDTFKVVSDFLCHYVLHLPDVHTHVDALAAYNGMVRGYT